MLKATYLATGFLRKCGFGLGFLKAGAMLHDVGRSQTNGIETCCKSGPKILEDNGFHRKS
jgi:HD superfamily phosphodiesterase